MSNLSDEVRRRRTFAIISHPDAGKTTLTEKLLLYGGAIHLAGSGQGAAGGAPRHLATGWRWSRSAASPSRPACCSSSTRARPSTCSTPRATRTSPRTRTARSSPRTAPSCCSTTARASRSRRASCSRSAACAGCRSSPSSTSATGRANPAQAHRRRRARARDRAAIPMTWPIVRRRPLRRRVRPRRRRRCTSSSAARTTAQSARGRVHGGSLDDAHDPGSHPRARALDAAAARTSSCSTWRATRSTARRSSAGELSPVFFGSALTNFGVEPFLRRFLELAPAPTPRESSTGDDRSAQAGRSRASCSRSRRTWIPSTATASRSCACARGGSRRGCR